MQNQLSGSLSERGCQWGSITEQGRGTSGASNTFLGLDSIFLNNLDMQN